MKYSAKKRIKVKLTVLDSHQACLRANTASRMNTLVPLALFLFVIIFMSFFFFFDFTILDIFDHMYIPKKAH